MTDKQRRRNILAQMDLWNTKRCADCTSGPDTKEKLECKCRAALEIRKLGKQYEAIAKEKRVDEKGESEKAEYLYWIKVAEKNGISRKLFQSRIRDYQYTLKDAATIKKCGSRSNKWLEIAKANSITGHAYRKRLSWGWSKQRAATEETQVGRRRKEEVAR